MNMIENLSPATAHSICLALAGLIVAAALTLGSLSADAEYRSAQRAEVIVEVA
jgi:hypothetical protein